MTASPLGKRNKDGVILKVKNQAFHYYNGMNDESLKPIIRERDNAQVKTIKVYESVTVANKMVSITLHPDGSYQVIHNQPAML